MVGSSRRPTIHKKSDDRNWGLPLLLLAIFLFIGGLFIEGDRGSREQSSMLPAREKSMDMSKRKVLKRLDYDLKDIDTKEKLRRAAIDNENDTAVSVDEETALEQSEHLDNINPLIFDQENAGRDVLHDTEDVSRRAHRPLTPEERIAAKIARDQWSDDYEERRQAEIVKQFIEKARRDGVEVRLNKNLDVTGINRFEVEKPIRIPQSESSTGNTDAGSSRGSK